jgi:hypothetical protein
MCSSDQITVRFKVLLLALLNIHTSCNVAVVPRIGVRLKHWELLPQ